MHAPRGAAARLRHTCPGTPVLSDRDRRVLLLLEQELQADDPGWVARCAPLLSGGRAPRRSWAGLWRVVAWLGVSVGVLMVVLSTGSPSPWGLAVGIFLAGGAVIALLTASD